VAAASSYVLLLTLSRYQEFVLTSGVIETDTLYSGHRRPQDASRPDRLGLG
jgi:hypothetical protein